MHLVDLELMIREILIPRQMEHGGVAVLAEKDGVLTYPWGWTVSIINRDWNLRFGYPADLVRVYLVERSGGTIHFIAGELRDLDIVHFLDSLGHKGDEFDLIPLDNAEPAEDGEDT